MPARSSHLTLTLATLLVALVSTGLAGAGGKAAASSPTLSGVSDISAVASYDCYQTFCATVDYPFTVSDPGYPSSELTLVCNDPLGGSTYLWGQTNGTCWARNPAGNTSQAVSFTVRVSVPPPTFQDVPATINAQATGPFGAVVTFFPPTAMDVGGQAVPVTCDRQSGITYPVGTTHVTCAATIMRNDSNGIAIGGLPTGTTQFAIVVSAPSSGASTSGNDASNGSTQTASESPTTGSSSNSTTANNASSATTENTKVVAIRRHPNVRLDATTPRGTSFTFVVTTTSAASAARCLPDAGSLFPLGVNAITKTTTVTCRIGGSPGTKPMSFEVTVPGARDQLAALESQVLRSGLRNASKLGLVSSLTRADSLVRKHQARAATKQLGSFVDLVGKTSLAGRTKSSWIGDAARVVAVIG